MSDLRPARVVPEEEARSLLTETEGEGLEASGRRVQWGGVTVAQITAENPDIAKLLAAAPDLAHTTLVLREREAKTALERDIARHDRDQLLLRVEELEARLRSGSGPAAKPPTTIWPPV